MNNKFKIITDEVNDEELKKQEDLQDTVDEVIASGDYEDIDDAIDSAESIESDLEEPEYATDERLDEIRDIIEGTDIRLFLINEDMEVLGKIDENGNILLLDLTSNDETGEKEFIFVDAPNKLDDLLNLKVIYNRPTEKDEEGNVVEYETPHADVIEYLTKVKMEDDVITKDEDDEDKQEVEDTEEQEVDKEVDDKDETKQD